MNPLDYAWKQKNGRYVSIWFTGPSLPENLFNVKDTTSKSDAVNDGQERQDDEYDAVEDSLSEPSWSDNSDFEADI